MARSGNSMMKFGLGALTGYLTAYFLDPQNGKRRRHTARDRSMATVRRSGKEAVRKADYAAGQAQGAMHSAMPSVGEKDYDDNTLTRKVESEIFRDPSAPKGTVSVNSENGVIYLRGEVPGEWIDRLAESARQVDGVKAVKNLLHKPGTPAPTQTDDGTTFSS